METRTKPETFNDILDAEKPVLIDFSATWCGPCKMMHPVLQELRQKTGDRLRIIKIDIDKSRAVADAFGIQAVPTLILIKKRNILWRGSGVMPANQLESIINQSLAKSNP